MKCWRIFRHLSVGKPLIASWMSELTGDMSAYFNLRGSLEAVKHFARTRTR